MFSLCRRSDGVSPQVHRVHVATQRKSSLLGLPIFEPESLDDGSVHGSVGGSMHGQVNGEFGKGPSAAHFPMNAWLNSRAAEAQETPDRVAYTTRQVDPVGNPISPLKSKLADNPVKRDIQSRRLSNAVSLRSDDGSSDRPGSSGQLASTRSPGRSLSPSHLETTAERANIYDCMSKRPDFADFWQGRASHRKKREERMQGGGGSPDGANPHMSQGALMSKMVDRRKAMHAQMSEEFPSLLQKGISVSNHKLGSGDFGCVYEGAMVASGVKVAVKCEPLSAPQDEQVLGQETEVLNELRGLPGVPKVMWYGVDGENHVLVMELLGKTVEGLFLYCQQRFTLKTALLMADQMIARLDTIHRKGIIHCDMKPDNLAMGRGPKANVVYLLDFGLARSYRDAMTLIHHPPEQGAGKTGNYRYCSMRAHAGEVAPSRRDDLESLAYLLIQCLKGHLPWQRLWNERKDQPKYAKVTESDFISAIKLKTPVETLCQGLPKEFTQFTHAVRALDYDEKPNYDGYRKMFRTLFDEQKFSHDSRWDWVVRQEKQDISAPLTPSRKPPGKKV